MYVQFNFWLRFNVCDRTTTLISRWDESIIMLSCVVLCYVIWLIVRKFAQKSQNWVQDQHKNWILNNSIQTIEWNTNIQVKCNCKTIITKRQNDLFSYCCSANYLELNFYYSDLVYHETTHEPEYTLMSIMGKWELHTRSALVNLCDYTSVCMPVHRRTC